MGYSEDLFWSLTPRQTQTHFEAAALRFEREAQEQRFQTWHIAALTRTDAKKFPSFKDFVRPQTARVRQRLTSEQELAIFRAWSAGRQRRRLKDQHR